MGTITVRVDRSTWLRGESGIGESYLLRREDGKRCCMGFYLLACGVSDSNMVGEGTVEHLAGESFMSTAKRPHFQDVFKSWPMAKDPNPFSRLYIANDQHDLTDTEREQELQTLGQEFGIAFEFEN